MRRPEHAVRWRSSICVWVMGAEMRPETKQRDTTQPFVDCDDYKTTT